MATDRGRLQPLDVDDTLQRRHQVVFVRWCTRAASAFRGLVGLSMSPFYIESDLRGMHASFSLSMRRMRCSQVGPDVRR